MISDQNSFPMPILLDDEPVTDSILFDFGKKDEDIADIVSIERQTPFAILLNEEWGSGKTSLMKIMQKIENNKTSKNKKVIWFNAWQYEGLDPRSALLVKIVQKCQSKSENAIDKIIKSIPNFNIGLGSFFNKYGFQRHNRTIY